MRIGSEERVGTIFACDGCQDVGLHAGHGGARVEAAVVAAQASIAGGVQPRQIIAPPHLGQTIFGGRDVSTCSLRVR